ncbi:MAG: hypothetical protein Q4C50_07025 [Eubacteriales bacterium]|nr:hypothetical protein [Eubacteriales bacterium]
MIFLEIYLIGAAVTFLIVLYLIQRMMTDEDMDKINHAGAETVGISVAIALFLGICWLPSLGALLCFKIGKRGGGRE